MQYTRDDKLLLELLARATAVATKSDFIGLLDDEVAKLLPHEIMICGIGHVAPDGSRLVQKFLNRGYPLDYYHALQRIDGRVDTPLMRQWRRSLRPVYFELGRDDADFPAEWVALVGKHGLRNLIGNGVLDLHGPCSSYFIFSRMPHAVGPREVEVLELITPQLHGALARIADELPSYLDPAHAEFELSARQKEILHWINLGKSNWEIARLLNTSQANVKYHVEQIYQKLGVSSRVQAVAQAKDLGLLQSARNLAG